MEMAGTWRIIVLLIACLPQSRCQAFGTGSLSQRFSAGLPVFKTSSLSLSSSGGGMKQFHDHSFRNWSFQLLNSQHSSSSSIWRKKNKKKLYLNCIILEISVAIWDGVYCGWWEAGTGLIHKHTHAHTCTPFCRSPLGKLLYAAIKFERLA